MAHCSFIYATQSPGNVGKTNKYSVVPTISRQRV